MSKKSDRALEVRDAPDAGGVMTLSDWFDHWPDLFARRWPESFRNLPFGSEMFRLEQFVDEAGTLVIRGEMPGIDPEADVTITVDEGHLIIKGERHQHEESEDNDTYRSEFQYGAFHRVLALPTGARPDDIAASYRDGILEVRVPVDEEHRDATRIPISTD